MSRMTPPGRWRRYIGAMRHLAFVPFLAAGFAIGLASGAGAQSIGETRALNALHDSARAQERQAESLRQLERIEHDRARDEDRARRNAERDSRSARRFDKR